MSTDAEPPTIGETTVKALIKAAAAIPAVGPPLSEMAQIIWDDVRQRRTAKVARTLGQIIDGAGGEDVVGGRLTASPDVEVLLVNAVDAATRSNYEAKRRLLVRAVVSALNDEAQLDEAALMIATLAELDTPHAKALARMAAEASNMPVDDNDWKWGASPAWKELSPPVKAALIRVGAAKVTPNTLVFDSNRTRASDGITEYGHEILVFLQAEADRDDQRSP